MYSLRPGSELAQLRDEIFDLAASKYAMQLPQIRFFVLESLEFAALLEKQVYPASPVNIWEGKRMLHKKHQISTGLESALYYEVVQTGNPSYAYLNDGNSAMTQASVMAHVCGHCEFSEINVLGDSDTDRTEYVMYLVAKTELARRQMGESNYINYWNACESIIPFIAPNAQFNLANSIEQETSFRPSDSSAQPEEDSPPKAIPFYSESLQTLLRPAREDQYHSVERELQRQEVLSRKGYRLHAPCQDIAGFLRSYAPASNTEHSVLDYLYVCHQHQDFVMRTQIMNEGWAMYWEKLMMLDLFAGDHVKGVIDYARVFSGVCSPRPFYARNPYHLGYHLWCHIKQQLDAGRLTLEYLEETDRETKDNWDLRNGKDSHTQMRQLVATITDYEFLRRYLSLELIQEYHLNRIPKRDTPFLNLQDSDIETADERYIWIEAAVARDQMLNFFVHYNRPRIYVIDNEFLDGGLLLYHRDDGRPLRQSWLKPTLHNFYAIWKAPVYLISRQWLYGYGAEGYKESNVQKLSFEMICERMQRQKKPFRLQ